MMDIWLGLFAGTAFGFVIQRVGATNPQKMAMAHLMKEPHIPQFMLLVVIFSATGLFFLDAAGGAVTRVLPISLVGTGLGGVIFGIGWGISGYCPGTCWAAAGEGRLDAIFTLIGGLAGAAAFAQVHESLIPILYMPTNMGQLTLTAWFGYPSVALGFLIILLGVGVWLIGRLWRQHGA